MFLEYALYTSIRKSVKLALIGSKNIKNTDDSGYYPHRTTQELLALAKQHRESTKTK
jgi:hypothetical protein